MFRFSHNKMAEIKDESLKKVDNYQVLIGVDRHFPLAMTDHMGRILQSGILGLWKKWEHIRYGPPNKDGATQISNDFDYDSICSDPIPSVLERCKKHKAKLNLQSRKRTRETFHIS